MQILSNQHLLTIKGNFRHFRQFLEAMLGCGIMVMSLNSQSAATQARPITNEIDARFWLENMLIHHGYTIRETQEATGLGIQKINTYVEKWKLHELPIRHLPKNAPILVLPYPGGRHPRIGFLEGAINPQRETKVSVFSPWDAHEYVVLDIPEAIWSNLGLTYLAHTHIPTVWDKNDITMEPLEWVRHADGSLTMERMLPNGIEFGTNVTPMKDHVRMEMWLQNGSKQRLSDLRVQNCVMLKGLSGFNQITNENKLFFDPYMACRTKDGRRWAITAWTPNHRTWANPPCPCMHSDPKFPDCKPGEKQVLRGWFSFYQGVDIIGEIQRIQSLNWDQ